MVFWLRLWLRYSWNGYLLLDLTIHNNQSQKRRVEILHMLSCFKWPPLKWTLFQEKVGFWCHHPLTLIWREVKRTYIMLRRDNPMNCVPALTAGTCATVYHNNQWRYINTLTCRIYCLGLSISLYHPKIHIFKKCCMFLWLKPPVAW